MPDKQTLALVKSLSETEFPKQFLLGVKRKKLLSVANIYAKILSHEKFSETTKEADLIESILEMIDKVEEMRGIGKPLLSGFDMFTEATSGDNEKGKSEIAGSFRNPYTDTSALGAPIDPKKAMVIPGASELIAPGAQCKAMHIEKSADNIAMVTRILSELYDAALKNPKLEVKSGDKTFLVFDVVKYGRKEGKRRFFSHPDLKEYLLEKANLVDYAPPQYHLKPLYSFVDEEIRIMRDKEVVARIEKVLKRLLETPNKKIKLEDGREKKVSDLIKIHRSERNQNTLYVDPALAPYVMKQLGIHPVAPENLEGLTSLSKHVMDISGATVLSRSITKKTDELEDFLTQLIISNPNLVINERTGRKLIDSVLTYRVPQAGAVTFIHNDIVPFLDFNWLAKMPNEGIWYSERKLLEALGVPKAKDAETYKLGNEIIHEELEKLFKRRHEVITLSNNDKCRIGDILKRVAKKGEEPKYFLESEGLGVILIREDIEMKITERKEAAGHKKFTNTFEKGKKNSPGGKT